jgi:hypothetical protein
MAADDRFCSPTERPTVFTAGIMELVAAAPILAPIALLIDLLLLLVARRKKN